ncbi:MAG: Nif3-like dinuclear metal center hexameric protein [Oscillospiraceae bacterium]|nr:Nif3-like dinuclear metal center hexameric protein [Oscillospiraceae bacterium]
MITASELEKVLFEIAPPELAEEWDNVGIMVDSCKASDKILFALDCTEEVIGEAKDRGCGIVVTHHPFIFHPLKRIDGRMAVYSAIRSDVSVLSVHTNYDAANNGVNDVLSSAIRLTDVETAGMGRTGYLDGGPVSLKSFCHMLKEELNAGTLEAADAGIPVHKVMVVGGSGGDFLSLAKENGCDTLLTGEAAHHEGIEAHVLGVNLVVAGHFRTENPSIPNLCRLVQEKIGNKAECFVSVRNTDPFKQI